MALFTDIEEVKSFVPVTISSDFPSILPFIEEVEENILIPSVGQELYDFITGEYAKGEEIGDLDGALLKRIQKAVANLAYLSSITFSQLSISSMGIHITSTENMKTAFQWQIEDLKTDFLSLGMNALGSVLEFLWKNLNTYDSFKNSDEYTASREFFINSARLFSRYCEIKNSWSLFTAMRSVMRKIEELNVIPKIGLALAAEIKAEILLDTISDDNKLILPLIQAAVANFTIAKAAAELALDIGPGGVSLKSSSIILTMNGKETAPEDRIFHFAQSKLADGEAYIKSLIAYLNANASLERYASYFSSSLYVAPGSGPEMPGMQNDSDSTIYSVL